MTQTATATSSTIPERMRASVLNGVKTLNIEQVPMSQQLMRLRADGLVESRREGTTVYYRIARPEVLTVVEALHTAFCPPDRKSEPSRANAQKRRS